MLRNTTNTGTKELTAVAVTGFKSFSFSVFNMFVSLSFSLSICLPMQCTGAVTAVPGVGLYYY